MIDLGLHVNKEFTEEVEKCINTTFDELTQHFIKITFIKNKYKCVSIINVS